MIVPHESNNQVSVSDRIEIRGKDEPKAENLLQKIKMLEGKVK
jgi:hypothetical protein